MAVEENPGLRFLGAEVQVEGPDAKVQLLSEVLIMVLVDALQGIVHIDPWHLRGDEVGDVEREGPSIVRRCKGDLWGMWVARKQAEESIVLYCRVKHSLALVGLK